MKNIKTFIGISVLVIATAAAFASKNLTRVVTVYYHTVTSCEPIVLPNLNCQLGGTGCTYNVPDVGVRQLYATDLGNTCADPYKAPPIPE